jgi:hypothetical protein
MPENIEFNEVSIQRLFGHEAAEDEDPQRLQQSYFKTSVYDRINTDLPVRVLVGHKGIGKSALLKVAIAEDMHKGKLAILIQPNDITDLGVDTSDFLHTVRSWIEGLREIIVRKVFLTLGVSERISLGMRDYRGGIIEYLSQVLPNLTWGDYDPARQDTILQFAQKPQLSIYVDDLDRGWQGRREDVIRISALLNAVRDLSNNNRSINFKIALRSDVYYLVRTSDESTDKIEGSVVWHTWTNHEIFVLLIKRIETYFGRSIDEEYLLRTRQHELARFLNPIMDAYFAGSGLWEHAPMYRVLMSLIRKRPRDLVKLCSLAAHSTQNRKGDLIRTDDFRSIFEDYSQGRIQDSINEYRSELPDIEKLLMNMKPSQKERTTKEGYVYKTDALLKKLTSVLQFGQMRFSDGKIAEAKDLAAFLYKINFLTARRELSDGSILRKYFEENRYLSSRFVDFGFDWEIHPAYRWALQPSDINSIFTSLSLSADDD